MDSKQREVNKKILDRIASDSKFRDDLLDDPRGAMERAGFKWEGNSEDEVSGYGLLFTTALECPDPNPKPSGGGGGVGSTAITCPDPMPGGGVGGGGGGGGWSTAITCPDPKPDKGGGTTTT